MLAIFNLIWINAWLGYSCVAVTPQYIFMAYLSCHGWHPLILVEDFLHSLSSTSALRPLVFYCKAVNFY